jgi:amino acid transporter
LLLPFYGWQQLVGFITAAFALMYAGGPIALAALRRELPDQSRPFRLRHASVLAPLAFIVVNLLVYWGGWNVDWKVFCAIAVGYGILAASYVVKKPDERPQLGLASGCWVIPWLLGLAALSYVGQYESPDDLVFGLPHIPFWWDIAAVSAWSIVIYYWALAVRLPRTEVLNLLTQVHEGDSPAGPHDRGRPGDCRSSTDISQMPEPAHFRRTK